MYRVAKTSKWLGFYKETKAEVKGFPANVKSIELAKDRPVLVDKNLQIIRLPSWENSAQSNGFNLMRAIAVMILCTYGVMFCRASQVGISIA